MIFWKIPAACAKMQEESIKMKDMCRYQKWKPLKFTAWKLIIHLEYGQPTQHQPAVGAMCVFILIGISYCQNNYIFAAIKNHPKQTHYLWIANHYCPHLFFWWYLFLQFRQSMHRIKQFRGQPLPHRRRETLRSKPWNGWTPPGRTATGEQSRKTVRVTPCSSALLTIRTPWL